MKDSRTATLAQGRDQLAIPGPSNIPDRVLRAMHRAAPNIYGGAIADTVATIKRDLRAVARTEGKCAIYIANGHGGWEATICNSFSRGDRVLVLYTGRFAKGWAAVAQALGVEVVSLDFRGSAPVDPSRVEDALRADPSIRAVLTVQTDTASSVTNDIPAIRAAIDAAGHPALLMVDCMASLACEPFEMDAWGVDLMVAGCQKGLMTPPGLAFTFHGPKADEARKRAGLVTPYWDWVPRTEATEFYMNFFGTAPTHHLFGLREALDMLAEEGLENVWERHRRFAQAVWAAVEAWGQGGPLSLQIPDPAHRSPAVTTIRTGEADADALRQWCEERSGLTLGVGLGLGDTRYEEGTFRIGHMGHLSPPMILGALATVDAGLKALGIAHGNGALDAAARSLAG